MSSHENAFRINVTSVLRRNLRRFSAFLPLCEGNYLSPVDFHRQGTVMRNFDLFCLVSFNKLFKQFIFQWHGPPHHLFAFFIDTFRVASLAMWQWNACSSLSEVMMTSSNGNIFRVTGTFTVVKRTRVPAGSLVKMTTDADVDSRRKRALIRSAGAYTWNV